MATLAFALSQNTNTRREVLCDGCGCLSKRSKVKEKADKEMVQEFTRTASNDWLEFTCDARTELWMSILNQVGKHSRATLDYYALQDKVNSVSFLQETILMKCHV